MIRKSAIAICLSIQGFSQIQIIEQEISPLPLKPALELEGEKIIQVYKQGILHKFVRFNPYVDFFTENLFENWEKETFEVFEQVKDRESIAIDLGAWIGTTAIWLSRNFYHVIVVEPDRESLKCLPRNLKASKCSNFTLCKDPISGVAQQVVFGPRGNDLNESVSCVKTKKNRPQDYVVQAITFEQLLSDYIQKNRALEGRKIRFIKCDIEGGEEEILEDLLQFALSNQCKVYISFHVSWWKEKKIKDFAPLLSRFKTNCPETDVCRYIQKNPFASILFEP